MWRKSDNWKVVKKVTHFLGQACHFALIYTGTLICRHFALILYFSPNRFLIGSFVLYMQMAHVNNFFIVGITEVEAYYCANTVIYRSNICIYSHYNMVTNELHINMSKCTYMHFRPRYITMRRGKHVQEHGY